MSYLKSRAFTLIELLVVIAIIAILAGVALPAYSSVQLTARKTQSLSNMRQWGAALIAYTADNNGLLPTQGTNSAAWSSSEDTAWYNALPKEVGSRMLTDYQSNKAGFYTKDSMFYVPAAKYPSTKLTAPLFAMAFGSKLYGTFTPVGSGGSVSITAIRMQNLAYPARTCIFQESGLPGETKIFPAQSTYNGQSSSFASRSITRYNGQTILVFADGHAGQYAGQEIVDKNTGKAILDSNSLQTTVLWTIDPSYNPNS